MSRCRKKAYRDRIGALMALADIQRRGNPNRTAHRHGGPCYVVDTERQEAEK